MAASSRCVREVTVFSSNQRSRLIDFSIGTAPATKITDEETQKYNIGGGFGYQTSGHSTTNNRFICWRIKENILELVEESLDLNLSGNVLKIRFLDGTILPGLSIYETPNAVCVLLATTASVHRIVFTHPNRLQGPVFGLASSYSQNVSSIFNITSIPELREPWNFATFSHCCVASSSWLCQDGHALFALATEGGSILLVTLPPHGVRDEPEIFELQQSSVMQRLWTGLVPSSLRGDSSLAEGIVDLEIHPVGQQMCIFTLCRDHKLRIWSYQKQECISVKDLLDDVPDDIDVNSASAQNHKIRITFDPLSNRLYVGVYFSLQYQNQFCVYEALVDGQDVDVSLVSNLYSQPGSLVDFALTSSDIWTQWTTNDGESVTYFTKFENSQSDNGWSKVKSESSISNSHIVVPPYKEPKEVYVNELFYPGRFYDLAIVKALQIYQHSIPSGFSTDDRSELKKQVIHLIDTEIQLSASNSELNYSEYYDLQLSCWEKFYSCVVQYQQVACEAVGLFVDKSTSLVAVIKKDMLSVLKQCEGAERLHLLSTVDENETFDEGELISKPLKKALCSVYNCIKLVSDQLTGDNKTDIENDLKYGCNPTQMAHQIAEAFITCQSENYEESVNTNSKLEMIQEIETSLHKVSNLFECFDVIVKSLDLSGIQLDSNTLGSPRIDIQPKFGSRFMQSVLSLSYQQTMKTCMSMCQDFLVFLALLDRLGVRAGIDPHFSQDISSLYIPKVVQLLRVYHSLHWISELEVTPPPSNVIEANLKQLAALEISDGNQAKSPDESPKTTVLKLFLRKAGGSQLNLLMSKIHKTQQEIEDSSGGVPISVLVNQAILCLASSIWPTNPNVILPEFLLTNYQYLHLQDYCRLIDSWCECSQAYRQFLCGQSYLILGEHLKALDCFLYAAQGIDAADVFMQNFLQADTSSKEDLVVLFYVKVMRLFEQFEVPDMVIAIANTAVSTANPDDPNIPNLWSNIFKHHLQLGHNDQAYAALTSNPDPSRKRDCLHRFMVVLCERGQLQELCEYPYVNLHEEFVDIMESHARTIDITTHQYYDMLYAFHIFRGNYRKAGSVMYEYGGRLGRELPGKNGLQKQAKCYLAAINALQLVDSKNAWIVTPWDRAQKKKEESPNMSPKRTQGDEEIWYGTDRKKRQPRKLTVMEIKDLEKENLLVLARLQLLRLDADPSQGTGPPLTPDETLTLLIQAGLFDTSFTLASAFNLSRDAIFEGITARCVRQSYNIGTTRTGMVDNKDTWEWLLENDTGNVQSLSHEKRIADQAWQLLQSYLEKLKGTSNCCVYYRCVVSKLLMMGASLPSWLINQYKRLNPSELLYLLVTYDMLQEAADLAIEYINAVLGEGKEYLGLKTGLHATTPSVWLPYTTLDHLLIALENASPNSDLAKMYDKLVDKLNTYHEQVQRVSEDMISTGWKRAQRRNKNESLPWQ